jgi:outer membrane protein
MITVRFLPLALMLCMAAPLVAQPAAEPLTLAQAIQRAIENNPAIKGAEAGVRSASGALTQVKSNYYPLLSATASAQRTGGAFVLNPSIPPRNQTYDTYTGGFQGNLLLFDFGRTINRVSAGSDLLDASTFDYDATRATVVANVEIAYFGVVQAQQVVKVNNEAVEQASRHLTQAKAFYDVGRRPLFDVTRAEVDLANANVNLIRARNQLRVANLQFENAMGVHPRSPFHLTDTLSVTPYAPDLDSTKAVAFDRRPELLAARTRMEANRSLAAAAWGQHLPSLSAFGSWTWSNFNFPLYNRWNAGVTLSLPIFQGFGIAGQVEQAQAAADLASANLQILRESLVLEVEQAYYALREAEERLVATRKLVEQAEQNMVLADRQYAAGVGTALDAADAQLSLSNARITDIQAMYDYNSSLVRLQKAMGMLGN